MAKHIVITGCDRGIGKCLSHMLSKQGFQLTLGVKNIDNAMESSGSNVTVRQLDLTNMSNVAQFARDIKDCHVLINNGGVMAGKVRKIHGVEETMLTNHLGHFYLTNLLLPTMRRTSIRDDVECRIINLASSLETKAMAFPGEDPTGKSALRGELPDSVQFGDRVSSADTFYGLLSGTSWMRDGPQPYFIHNSYANASLCILLSTTRLSKLLSNNSEIPYLGGKDSSYGKHECVNSMTHHGVPRVTVNAVCPGYVNTAMWQESMLWNIVRRFAFKSPKVASEFITSAATSADYDNKTGNLFSVIPDMKPSKMAQSAQLEEMVWTESCALVQKLRELELGDASAAV